MASKRKLDEFLAQGDKDKRLLKRREDEIKGLRSSLKRATEKIVELEDHLDFSEAIRDIDILPGIRPRHGKSKTEGVPIAMWSDWHVEEVVDPRTIDGLNDYNPTIAKRSATNLVKNTQKQIDTLRHGGRIDEIIIWLGGDMIGGYIHDELVESNAMSPIEATLFCQSMIVRNIDFLLEHGNYERIHIYCNFGNHGRTHKKPRVATAAVNNFEWGMYQNLAAHYAKEDKVNIHTTRGAQIYFNIMGTEVRGHHGDGVRYLGGVGGLSVPLRKATDSWDKSRNADFTIIGHYHTWVDFGYAAVNGSLKGYDAYARDVVKARYEPPRQGLVLIDKHYGKTMSMPIYVRELMK